MIYDSKTIAEWFIHRAEREGEYLTQMKLQKLVYIAHGWNLGLFGEPLIDDFVEAWQWGPVIRSLYSDYVMYGGGPINMEDISDCPRVGRRTAKLLEKVWEKYGHYTAAQLVNLTHRDGTPWTAVYSPRVKRMIPNKLIRSHYKKLASIQ
jgi:uncharacterized phage-associated protein